MRSVTMLYLRAGVNEHIFDVAVHLHDLGERLGDHVMQASSSSFWSRMHSYLMSDILVITVTPMMNVA